MLREKIKKSHDAHPARIIVDLGRVGIGTFNVLGL
jgi:hypothetical protein